MRTRALPIACLLLAPFLAPFLAAQDRPLASLPYTPSLELKFLDRAADPCVDFYRFACGNWNSLNPIPADQARWNVYSKLATENMQYLWGMLEDYAKPAPGRSPNQQKIGDYFAACMDEAGIERAGTRPIEKGLSEIAALKNAAGLAPLVARLHLDAGLPGRFLFEFGSNQDFADSEQVIAFASAGGLGLPDRDYYLKADAKSQETRQRYLAHVARLFGLLGDAPATSRAEAATVMDIETALAKATLTRVERRDPYKLFHKLSRAELEKLTPRFDWPEYWQTVGLPAPAVINVTEPEFFRQVESLLEARPIGDWKTYLRWHLAAALAPYLSRAFVTEDFDFNSQYLRGVKQLEPRWKRCVRRVDRDLGEALGQVFVERTFTPETKASALAMTRQIEKAMEADLHQIDWMSDATKQKALEKLHGVVNKIGYPDRWRDYSSVDIVPGDYAGNAARCARFENRRQLAKIGKPVDHGEWEITPPTVNAYYDPQMNDINFPAGVLEPPLYDPKMDDAPNYGNTGATIGHELTHGFDDEGRQFDAKGNLKDWWTKQDADAFVERATCVSTQYSGYRSTAN
jgi:putative endopeptidase